MAWCVLSLLSDRGYVLVIILTLLFDCASQCAVWILDTPEVAQPCRIWCALMDSNSWLQTSVIDSMALMVSRVAILPVLFWISYVLWQRRAREALRALHGDTELRQISNELRIPLTAASGDPEEGMGGERETATSSIEMRKQEYVQWMKAAIKQRNGIMAFTFSIYTAQAVYMGVKTVAFLRQNSAIEGCIGVGAFCCFMEYFLLLDYLKLNTRDKGEIIPTLHPHPLFYDIGLECHGCDICHEGMKKPVYDAYRCRTCDFDLCPRCYKNKDNPEFKGVGGLQTGQALSIKQYVARLLQFALPFWHLLAITLFCLCICQGLYVSIPNIQGRILDAVNSVARGTTDLDQFTHLIFVFIVVNLLLGVFSGLQTMGVQLVMTKLRNAVRVKLFNSILRMDIGFFDAMHTGQLQSRMNNDCNAMIDPLSILISQMLAQSFLLVGGLCMAFYTSWKLAILAMTIVPPISFAYRLYAKWGRKLNRSIWQAYGECSKVSNEALSNIRTVRAFAAESEETDNFGHGINVTIKLQKKNAFVSASVDCFRGYMNMCTSALILWYGGHLVMDPDPSMTIGNLMTFQLYWNMINNAFLSLGNVFNELIRSSSAAERVFQVMDSVPEMDPDEGEKVTSCKGYIVCENVHFTYRTRPSNEVLCGVNLELFPRKVTALVGKSGGGKSTLVHLLLRYYDPTKGRILVDGKDLRTLCARDIRKFIGFVSQDTQLFAKSVRENLTYGLHDVSDADIVEAATLANCHEFISELEEGYDTRCGEKGVQFSGGQKQRLALARCFLRKPTILLLDEATSALDAENESLVQTGIDTLLKRCDSTVCLIAHRLSTVMEAFQIAVIHKGTIAEIGSHGELVERKGIYAQLVSKQIARDANIIKEHSPRNKSKDGETEIDALFDTIESNGNHSGP